jgi:glucosylceramidase
MRKHIPTLSLFLSILLSACSSLESVQVISSLPDTDKLFVEKRTPFLKKVDTGLPIQTIHTDAECQRVEGVGAALTHASAYVLNHNLTAQQRDSLFRILFTPQGIGLNYTRLCIGASDFAFNLFSYSEQEDFTLNNFSIAEDYKDVIPMLKEIRAINPHLQIMATPWSPPGWMKTSNSMVGGKLRTDCYDVYADYLIRYLQAYDKEGIPIQTITVQNEPEYGTAAYSCMDMTAEEQKVFIRDHFGPKLQASGLTTKIVLFDHNCDNPDYPIQILNDSIARKYADGSGFHLYKGDISALCKVHEAHPNRSIYFTEQSGGAWAPDFDQNVRWYAGELIAGAMNCWSKNVLVWNLALDENYGPKNTGCQDCYGLVEVSSKGKVKNNAEYYALGHYGKAVQYGANRLESDGDALKGVAFKNPDGTLVYLGVYYGKEPKEIVLHTGKKVFAYTFSPGEVATFKWSE